MKPRGEWTESSLGECFRIKHGWAFKGEFFAESGPFVLLTPGNFKEDGGLQARGEREKFYVGEFPHEFLLKTGELLIVMTDLTQNAPILGSPAIVPCDDTYLHNQRLGKVVYLDESKLTKPFLYHLLNSRNVREQIKATATGATVRHTAPDRIYSVRTMLPPIYVQEHIASILSAYDALIENNVRRIKLVKKIADTIFKGAHTHSAKFWHFVPISNLYAGLYDGPHATPKPSESGPIFLGIHNLTERGELDLSSIRHIAEQDFATWTRRVLPVAEDIVFTYEATLHRYGMIREGFRGCLGRRLALIRPDLERVDPYFLLYAMLDEEWRKEVTSKIISGATVDRVPLTDFPQFRLRVPPLALQREIGASIRACEKLANNCSRRNRILRATRDFLLPKLISGEISVEHFDAEAVAQNV